MAVVFAGPRPSTPERLLAGRVALRWLGLAVEECAYYLTLAWGVDASDDEFHQQRAQRRYLAAIKALATVRRLGVPTVQINVADQRINMSG